MILATAFNKIKDGYLFVADWVDDNPQKAIWGFALLYAGTFAALVG